ncbi:MAG: SEC-C metal-binding domain-containing protein [Desulfobacteraceae bacterium]|nr:SEC-C metal-binding domain-containing protein [Desulfobacteraceae bacterium]
MAKIGRNDPCPCGSGKKFKKCCYGKQQESAVAAPQVSLRAEVAKIQEAAAKKEARVVHLGVFVLFATGAGDAWLLELTDMDGVMVASGGEKIEVEMEEGAETIEVNWSHRFTFRDKKFVATAYKDQAVTVHEDYPAHSIQSAIRKIRKKFSPETLKNIHISQEPATQG